jgi:hypothetical protein
MIGEYVILWRSSASIILYSALAEFGGAEPILFAIFFGLPVPYIFFNRYHCLHFPETMPVPWFTHHPIRVQS